MSANGTGESSLNGSLELKERDALEAKMVAIFAKEIKQLSTDLQQILIDDMITAFENRVNVLNRSKARTKVRC
jgi:hypothetical protein